MQPTDKNNILITFSLRKPIPNNDIFICELSGVVKGLIQIGYNVLLYSDTTNKYAPKILGARHIQNPENESYDYVIIHDNVGLNLINDKPFVYKYNKNLSQMPLVKEGRVVVEFPNGGKEIKRVKSYEIYHIPYSVDTLNIFNEKFPEFIKRTPTIGMLFSENELKMFPKTLNFEQIEPQQARNLDKYDIIITYGRRAVETVLRGKNVICGHPAIGIDGLVQPDNWEKFYKNDFSGKTVKKPFTLKTISKEIEKINQTELQILKLVFAEYFDNVTNSAKILNLLVEKASVRSIF